MRASALAKSALAITTIVIMPLVAGALLGPLYSLSDDSSAIGSPRARTRWVCRVAVTRPAT
ncbi:MAG: hypothetical protein ABI647_27155 [Gemmatimonadota bacterium]